MSLPRPYYERDGITLYHADCRELLPYVAADVLVTDPPYGMAHVSHSSDLPGRKSRPGWRSRWHGIRIAGDDSTALRDAVLEWWGTDRPALVFGTWKTAQPRGVREILIWDKVVSTGTGDLSVPWRPSWEMVYVIGQGFVGPRGHGVLQCSLPTMAPERSWHPTPKPWRLIADLLAKCPLGTVLDPFAGSGTTLVAAASLGRRAIGIELEERYCEIAANRLAQGVLPFEAAPTPAAAPRQEALAL